MSTICKLDPNVRSARVRRLTAVQEMYRLGRGFSDPKAQFRISSLASSLDDVRHDPRFSGAQKDAKFKSLLNRAR